MGIQSSARNVKHGLRQTTGLNAETPFSSYVDVIARARHLRPRTVRRIMLRQLTGTSSISEVCQEYGAYIEARTGTFPQRVAPVEAVRFMQDPVQVQALKTFRELRDAKLKKFQGFAWLNRDVAAERAASEARQEAFADLPELSSGGSLTDGMAAARPSSPFKEFTKPSQFGTANMANDPLVFLEARMPRDSADPEPHDVLSWEFGAVRMQASPMILVGSDPESVDAAMAAMAGQRDGQDEPPAVFATTMPESIVKSDLITWARHEGPAPQVLDMSVDSATYGHLIDVPGPDAVIKAQETAALSWGEAAYEMNAASAEAAGRAEEGGELIPEDALIVLDDLGPGIYGVTAGGVRIGQIEASGKRWIAWDGVAVQIGPKHDSKGKATKALIDAWNAAVRA